MHLHLSVKSCRQPTKSYQMPTNYKYLSLNPTLGEFRVLTLQPGSGTASIQCLIQTTSITTPTSYEALSYCWGDSSVTEDIELEGLRFAVTTNLFAALHSLRLEHSPRTLWIDAICINQGSVKERESQVGLMRKLYQQASRVVIWLGPSRPKTGPAFRFFSLLTPSGAATRLFGTYVTNEELLRQGELVANIHQALSSNSLLRECAQILFSDVLTRDWWHRAWIIQEAALAQSLLVKCGGDELDWDHFWGVTYDLFLACAFLDNFTGKFEDRIKRVLDFERMNTIQFFRSLTRRETRLPLSDLVVLSRMSRATDPKDMIYALLGLAQEGIDPILMPKYSPSISYIEVYTDLVEYCIFQDCSLDIITLSRQGVSTHGVPTWVPDWHVWSRTFDVNASDISADIMVEYPLISRYSDSENMQEHLRHQVMHGDVQSLRSPWRASADFPPDAVVSRRPAVTLTSKGLFVDTILEVSTYEFESSPHDWEHVMFESFGNAISQSGNHSVFSVIDCCNRLIFRSHKDSLEMIKTMSWTTWLMEWTLLWADFWFNCLLSYLICLCYRMMWARRYPPEHLSYVGGGDVVDAFAKTLFANQLSSGRFARDNFEGFWTGRAPNELLGGDAAYWSIMHSALITSVRCRRIFSTEDGYIGLAPSTALKGDLVCVLLGCSVPVVLREEGDHYIFIGECYTHGIMDGEAIDGAAANGFGVESFEIH
jgi:hypothetical protein